MRASVLVFAESPKAFFVSVARALSGLGGWRRARGAGVAGVTKFRLRVSAPRIQIRIEMGGCVGNTR